MKIKPPNIPKELPLVTDFQGLTRKLKYSEYDIAGLRVKDEFIMTSILAGKPFAILFGKIAALLTANSLSVPLLTPYSKVAIFPTAILRKAIGNTVQSRTPRPLAPGLPKASGRK